MNGLRYWSHSARTPRRFSIDTGCPPPELFVTVTMTSGTRSPLGFSVRSSAARSMLPLNGCTSAGTRPSAIDEVARFGALGLDVGARRVEVVVVRDDLAGLQHRVEQNPLGRASLVCRDDVAEAGEVLDDALEAVERPAPGIGLVALHQRAPLRGRHRAGAGVGQQVDEDVVGAQQEQVVARLLERAHALLTRREAERFDGLDAEGFDDGVEGHVRCSGQLSAGSWQRSSATARPLPAASYAFPSSPAAACDTCSSASWTIRIASGGPMKSSTTTCLCSSVL